LPTTLLSLRQLPDYFDILVVNDGSRDQTRLVAEEAAQNSQRAIHVVSLPLNCGIGVAVQTGYVYALKTGVYKYDIHFDADGQLVTGSFMDYAMPRASDVSAIDIDSHPVPTKTNPLGVKGAGEAGSVGALPAVGNALVDALSVLGIDEVPMPATPEKLWRAIREARR